jgi:hypothetical protein
MIDEVKQSQTRAGWGIWAKPPGPGPGAMPAALRGRVLSLESDRSTRRQSGALSRGNLVSTFPARSQTATAHQIATHVRWRSDGSDPSGAPAPSRIGDPRRGHGRRGRNDHKSRRHNDLGAIRTAVGRRLPWSGRAGRPARRSVRIRPPSSWRSDALRAGQAGHLQMANSSEGRSWETRTFEQETNC